MNKSEEEEEEEHIVTFEEFSKIHLKIGKIIQAEIIAGMEKILKVKVDVGIDQRDLVVGAALFYRPEELIGKKVVVCTNLKPRKIANIISNGMLLAAEGTAGKPEFLTITEDIPIGATVH
jgi:methionine--tRNA ligase beta chain